MAAPASSAPRTAPAAITGLGAVTSVGLGARAACAAIRAGLSRPAPFEDFPILDEETQSPVPLVAHPVAGFTEGFSFMGRWMRLARGAFDDLLRSGAVAAPDDDRFWAATALLAATPPPDDELFLPEEEGGAVAMLRDGFLGPLQGMLGVPLQPANVALVPTGQAGVAEAFRIALGRLAGDGPERVVVMGVDSLLEPLRLQRLASEDRLKTDENPTGLSPGEAAACVLLERPSSARRRGVPALAMAAGAAVDHEPVPDDDGPRPTQGRALARCLRAAAERLSPGPFAGDLVHDLTGETWRAAEWGTALVRLERAMGPFRAHLPATSLGDTGAASAAVGVCLGVHLVRRGAALNGTSIVASSDEGGDVGAIALGPPAR